MTRAELARLIDHSVLRPEATEGDIRTGADIVRRWTIAYYCVQPYWVATAAQLLVDTNARIVTVVGFPHGCDRSDVKAHGAAAAHADGAQEIDMVLNVGALKSGMPIGAQRRRRVRENVDGLPSLGRCDRCRCPVAPRPSRTRFRCESVRRDSHAGGRFGDDRGGRQSNRRIGQRRNSRGAGARLSRLHLRRHRKPHGNDKTVAMVGRTQLDGRVMRVGDPLDD